MNYQEAQEFIENNLYSYQGSGGLPPSWELKTTYDLADAFGNPQEKLICVHVAGTNGKGSSCAMLASVLQESGYKTGVHVSPHIIDMRERLTINGAMMPKETFASYITQYESVIKEQKPSFFELMSVLAMKYFVDQKVDIAVMEVGLGGAFGCYEYYNPRSLPDYQYKL